MKIRIDGTSAKGWIATPVGYNRSTRRSTNFTSSIPGEFLADGVEVVGTWAVEPAVQRTATETAAVDFTVETPSGDGAVVAVRHPTGAITFHRAVAFAPTAIPAEDLAAIDSILGAFDDAAQKTPPTQDTASTPRSPKSNNSEQRRKSSSKPSAPHMRLRGHFESTPA